MYKSILLFIVLSFIMFSCTDASIANWQAYGEKHRIRMFNGGILVSEWISTGKVTSMENSDGWQFMDSKSGKLVRVGGDVIIEVLE